MVGPAFGLGALAAVATLIPFPVGAADMPFLADQGLNPSMMGSSAAEFPTVAQYMAGFVRNAAITGLLAASPAMYRQYEKMQEDGGEVKTAQ